MFDLRLPRNETELTALHDLREEVLFKRRGRDDYDRNNPGDTAPGNYFMGFWRDDALLGTLRIDFLDETRAALRRVAIRPDRQRQGIGREMLRQAEVFIQQRQRTVAVSNVAADAVEFYARLGYSKNLWHKSGEASTDMSVVPMLKEVGRGKIRCSNVRDVPCVEAKKASKVTSKLRGT
jgi:ribosomal protein S18 acetylase RimI-like enzyme